MDEGYESFDEAIKQKKSRADKKAEKKRRRQEKLGVSEFSKTKLSVKNLPDSCTNDMLSTLFSDSGDVKFAFVVKNKQDGSCNGSGFVQFGSETECEAALRKMQGFKFMGNRLQVGFARRRLRQMAALGDDKPAPAPAVAPVAAAPLPAPARTAPQQQQPSHDGRLIVRNLGFNVKENDLRAAFEPYGQIVECRVVMKDGKPRGFGFVEFKTHSEAQQALQKVNGTEIRKRVVAVDVCLPKNTFIQKLAEEPQEDNDNDEDDVGDDSGSGNDGSDGGEDDDDFDRDLKMRKVDDEQEEEDDDDSEAARAKYEATVSELREREKGRNVFVQNIPFEATRKDVIMAFKDCGRIEKVVLVTDPATGRPRGTGFVIFEKPEGAQKCLEKSGREVSEDFRVKVLGRPIITCEPLDQRQVKDISKKRKENKAEYIGYDKRNIKLAEVGRIDQESPVWAQLSKNDKEKRIAAIQRKKQKLQNPNFKVSPVRLSVRNLPKSVDVAQLKHMFSAGRAGVLKHSTIIKDEAGLSKGYGFVEFKKHDEALKALHRVNNNSSLFGPEKRPIVEFAIDDVRALKLLEARTEKNRVKQKRQREEVVEQDPAIIQQQALAEAKERKKIRKLSKQKKREMKEKILRRDEIKKAKRARREKRRSQREANAADDDIEIAAKMRMAMREKKLAK